ncbi:hypothetical protein IWQ61_000246 [Dispira simplex]|nr:hypothetical protein IWQ61_000246 [Dispira simplex]
MADQQTESCSPGHSSNDNAPVDSTATANIRRLKERVINVHKVIAMCDATKKQLKTSQADLEKEKRDNGQLRAVLEALQTRLMAEKRRADLLENGKQTNEHINQEIATLRDENHRLTRELGQRKTVAETLADTQRLAKLTKQLEGTQSKLRELEDRHQEMVDTAVHKACANISQEQTDRSNKLVAENATLGTRLQDALSQNDTFQDKIMDLELEATQLRESVENQQRGEEKLREELKRTQTERDQIGRDHQETQDALQVTQQECIDLKNRVAELELAQTRTKYTDIPNHTMEVVATSPSAEEELLRAQLKERDTSIQALQKCIAEMTEENRRLKSQSVPSGNGTSPSPQHVTELQDQKRRSETLADQVEYLTKAQLALQGLVTEQQLTIAELREQLRNATTAAPKPTKPTQRRPAAEPITIIHTSRDQFRKSEKIETAEQELDNAVSPSPKKPTPATPSKRKANARTITARKTRRKDSNSMTMAKEVELAALAEDQQTVSILSKDPTPPTNTSTTVPIQEETPSVVPSMEGEIASPNANSVANRSTDEIRVTVTPGPTPQQKSPTDTIVNDPWQAWLAGIGVRTRQQLHRLQQSPHDARAFTRELLQALSMNPEAPDFHVALVAVDSIPGDLSVTELGQGIEEILRKKNVIESMLGKSNDEKKTLASHVHISTANHLDSQMISDSIPPLSSVTHLAPLLPEISMCATLFDDERFMVLTLYILGWRHHCHEFLNDFLRWITHRILFRYQEATDLALVSPLIRIFTMLCRLVGDIQRVRVFCFQMLFETEAGRHVLAVLSSVAAVWPEVLRYPNNSPDFPKGASGTLLCFLDLTQSIMAGVFDCSMDDKQGKVPVRVYALLYTRFILYCGWQQPSVAPFIDQIADHIKHVKDGTELDGTVPLDADDKRVLGKFEELLQKYGGNDDLVA